MDRRKSRRFAVGWPIRIKTVGNGGPAFEETGVLENLSSTGAYLYTAAELKVGAKIEVSIRVPVESDRWMRYPAEVTRIDGRLPNLGVAMRFQTVKPAFESH